MGKLLGVDAAFVLVHSPLVGPGTWAPVAARVRDAGATVHLPSLADVADAPPPYWPRVVELVVAGIRALPAGQPVLLVAHSKAGLFLPPIVAASPRTVAGCVLVDGPALPGLLSGHAAAGRVPAAGLVIVEGFVLDALCGRRCIGAPSAEGGWRLG